MEIYIPKLWPAFPPLCSNYLCRHVSHADNLVSNVNYV